MALGTILAGAGALASAFGNKSASTSTRHKTMEGLDFWQNYTQQAQQHDMGIQTQTLANTLAQEAAFRNIQHKVRDAKAAGLHPLYALGAQAASSGLHAVFPGQSQFTAPQGQSSTGNAAGDALSGIGNVLQSHSNSKVARANALQQTALNAGTLGEMRSRSRLNNAKADALLLAAAASANKTGSSRANAKQDRHKTSPKVMRTVVGDFTPGGQTPHQELEDQTGGLFAEPLSFMSSVRDVYKQHSRNAHKYDRFGRKKKYYTGGKF